MQKFPVNYFYIVKFKKLKSNHNNLRVTEENDNSVIGYAPYLPKEKTSFLMFSKGLTGQSVRVIKTSLITEVKEPNDSFPRSFKIKTENSEYSILILDKIESKLVEDFIDECFNKADPILEKYMERFDSQQPKSIN